jgi:DNA-binding NarL/FixJ family response regulator
VNAQPVPARRLRVLVADDHPPTRQDVREALEADPRFEVCAEAFDAPGAIDAALRLVPDLCLLDIEMPGGGIGAVWEIGARVPTATIVMLTVADDDAHLFAALQAGAAGYLLKDMDLARLPDALAGIEEGEAPLPRRLVARVVGEFRDRAPRRRAVVLPPDGTRLTAREWEVLELLRQGLTTAQIARRLVLSPGTVRTHSSAAMRKLGVADREEALRLFGPPERR